MINSIVFLKTKNQFLVYEFEYRLAQAHKRPSGRGLESPELVSTTRVNRTFNASHYQLPPSHISKYPTAIMRSVISSALLFAVITTIVPSITASPVGEKGSKVPATTSSLTTNVSIYISCYLYPVI
jgi:hypothetical protein